MVHASRYQDFLEDAFLHWLEAIGLPYRSVMATGLHLAIGTTTIQYRQPAHLGDRLSVTTRGAQSTTSTVTVEFTVVRDDGVLIAEAAITYIAVRASKSVPLPPELSLPGGEDLTPPELLAHLHDAQARFYAGESATQLEAILHPDVSWHVPGTSPIAGEYIGRRAVIAYMARRRDLAARSFRMHRSEVLIGPSHFAACFLLPFDQEAFDRVWSATT
jgi:YbgC/YbaW family acyl-CoA thioester hydrolase